MNTIIKENSITFKELEKNIFQKICQMGRDITKKVLETYDRSLMDSRDTQIYRNKGPRQTTIKTIYGEVAYRRNIYEIRGGGNTKKYTYLLDEALQLENTGLISANLAEQLVSGITEMSYRECAKKISAMTGQSISAMGVWNVIQSLGEKVCEEEAELVKAYKAGKLRGTEEAPVLFEEADGVYVNLQGEDRKKTGQKHAEIKVGIAYDGWEKTGRDSYRLDGIVVAAGFSKAKEFQEYREAVIAEKYNLDETEVRILNADGSSWIKGVKDKSTHFQLDPFHKYKAIRENIPDRKAAVDIRELLDAGEIDEMFRYLELYHNSLPEEEAEKVEDLMRYFKNNQRGLLPYQKQGIDLPESPEGLEYRSMGTMENHIWSIIAKRMKHNHTSWSRQGGNHLAKILARKCSGRLNEVTEKLKRQVFEEEKIEEIQEQILMAAKAPRKDGKGYAYPITGHLSGLDGAIRGDRKKLLAMAGY